MSEAREAAWTLNPIVERSIAEERRGVRGNRRTGWALTLVGFGLCPLTCLGSVADMIGSIPVFAALVAFFALLVEKVRRSTKVAVLADAKRASLQEFNQPVDGWIVELTILQGATPTGQDRGTLWFEDDRLFFAGERTSFALAASQVVSPVRRATSLGIFRSSLTLRLSHRTEIGLVSLGLTFIAIDGYKPGASTEIGLQEGLKVWTERAAPALGGLPPLGLGPDIPSPSALFGGALAVTTYWIANGIELVLLFAYTAWWIAVPSACFMGALLLVWSDLWFPRLRWRAWYDRNRLENGS